METKHLAAFLKIVETGNFQKAADELYISQSSLSKQVQRLEETLGVKLFDRTGRSATLTPAGEILKAGAPDFMGHFNRLAGEVSATRWELCLSVLPIWECYGLAQKTMEFLKENPQVQLKIDEAPNGEIPKKLREGGCHLGIFRLSAGEEAQWRCLPLVADRLVLVVPPTAPYRQGQQVQLAAFSNEPFILLGKDTQLYEQSLGACHQAGFSPKVVYQGSSAETIQLFVSEGKGVAIFMEQVAQQQTSTNNKILQFSPEVRGQLVLAYPKGQRLNTAGQLLWEFLSPRENA